MISIAADRHSMHSMHNMARVTISVEELQESLADILDTQKTLLLLD